MYIIPSTETLPPSCFRAIVNWPTGIPWALSLRSTSLISLMAIKSGRFSWAHCTKLSKLYSSPKDIVGSKSLKAFRSLRFFSRALSFSRAAWYDSDSFLRTLLFFLVFCHSASIRAFSFSSSCFASSICLSRVSSSVGVDWAIEDMAIRASISSLYLSTSCSLSVRASLPSLTTLAAIPLVTADGNVLKSLLLCSL